MHVSNAKTGESKPAATFRIAVKIARRLGWKDWEWCPAWAPDPATIRETTEAMRQRGAV